MEATPIATISAYRHDDEDNNNEEKEPLLIASLMNSSLTYTKLFHWMKRIRFDNDDDDTMKTIDTSTGTTTATTTENSASSTTTIPSVQSILNSMTSRRPVTSSTTKARKTINTSSTSITTGTTITTTTTTTTTTKTEKSASSTTTISSVQSILNSIASRRPVSTSSTISPTSRKKLKGIDTNNNNNHHDDVDNKQQFLPNELIVRILEYVTIQRVKHEIVTAILCSSNSDSTTFPLSCILNDNETSWWISASPTREQIEQQRLIGGLETKKGEYVEFSFIPPSTTLSNHHNTTPALSSQHNNNHKQSMYRLTTVSMKIPPMPIGPCSVAEFHLERKIEKNDKCLKEEQWYKFTPSYVVDNRVGYQAFAVNETFGIGNTSSSSVENNDNNFIVVPLVPSNQYVDIDHIRVVCTKNQLYRMMYQGRERPPGAVGEVRTTHNLDEFSQVGYYSIRFD